MRYQVCLAKQQTISQRPAQFVRSGGKRGSNAIPGSDGSGEGLGGPRLDAQYATGGGGAADLKAPLSWPGSGPEDLSTRLQRMEVVLYTLIETIRQISIMLQPFIPNTSKSILDHIQIPLVQRDIKSIELFFDGGIKISTPKPLFPRV